MNCPRGGLYALTQTENKPLATVLAEVAAVIRGGAVMVQYRDKQPVDAFVWALALADVCRSFKVPLIINDDIELAARVGAGVHLGKDDGEVRYARERLGIGAVIGVSCYNDLTRALEAARHGADYVAFGRFFPSDTKPLASPADLLTLRQAKRELTLPVVAIGGILPDNAGNLLDVGADLLAVIGGLYDGGEPEQAARAYSGLFRL